jgi:CubicO group peptidase (beta-lactamase class C family)
MMDLPQSALRGWILAVWLLVSYATAEEEGSNLPGGYREVGSDKALALQQLCQATADKGLFSGAVLVAHQGEIIYQEAFGLANREWNIPNTTDT